MMEPQWPVRGDDGPVSWSLLSPGPASRKGKTALSRSFTRVRAHASATGLAGLAVLLLAGASAHAQEAEPEDAEVDVEEVVVTPSRIPRGSARVDLAPELVLGPGDIRAYGAASVAELLEALSPQLGSAQGSGPPVVLVDGGRISGFREIRDLPTEAIVRMDILPEEAALRYGYSAQQKVVNFVLRRRFQAWLAEGSVDGPTRSGGGETISARVSRLSIRNGRRLTADLRRQTTSALSEADRNVPGDEAAFRTLQPAASAAILNAVYARPFENGASASVNFTGEIRDGEAWLGRAGLGEGPLMRETGSAEAQLAGAVRGAWRGWLWSATAEVGRTSERSHTQREAGGLGFTDLGRSKSLSSKADLVASRPLLDLPAGALSATFTLRAAASQLDSRSLRAGAWSDADLGRQGAEARANFEIPLLRGGAEGVGRLSANLDLGGETLSDFGELSSLNAGLSWIAAPRLRILLQASRTEEAPGLGQLGLPAVVTPGLRVYDLASGQTVEAIRIGGGRPDLQAARKDLIKLGINWSSPPSTGLTFQANYVLGRTYREITEFPTVSTQLETAFPERFSRDAQGQLLLVDARPINIAERTTQSLRWSLSWSRRFGSRPGQAPAPIAGARPRPDAASEGGARTSQPPQGERPRGDRASGERAGGVSGWGGRGAGRQGVLRLSLTHAVNFRDEALLADGLPRLDLLGGGVLGPGAGTPRHQVDFQANYTRYGRGASASLRWRSGARIDAAGQGEDLVFDDRFLVNLRLFADLGRQSFARQRPWLRGARASLSVDNLFDARQLVRTESGQTPLRYQAGQLDPLGRTVRLELRKMFF